VIREFIKCGNTGKQGMKINFLKNKTTVFALEDRSQYPSFIA